jgi:hypothetical protein
LKFGASKSWNACTRQLAFELLIRLVRCGAMTRDERREGGRD